MSVFLSDAMTAALGRDETVVKEPEFCEFWIPLALVFQRMVPPLADSAILDPETSSAAP